MQTEIKDALEQAYSIIDKKGWTSGEYMNEYGYCITGALIEAADCYFTHDDQVYLGAIDALEAHLAANRPDEWEKVSGGIIHWNDDICAGKEDALSLLDSTVRSMH